MYKKLIYLVSFVLVLGLVGASATGDDIDPSLVGWWTFDEGSGTVAKDVSGRSVDATFFGEPKWDKDGQHRGILLFDPSDDSDDYVFIDGSFNLPVYTMAVWFRVDDGSGQRDILSAYAPGVQHGILLELQADGTLRYLHRYPLGTGGGNNIYTTTTYDDGAWYHAAMVKSADQITLYINGQEVGSAADSSEFNPGDTFGVALGILDDERGAARLFPGAMDDVRIYNRALSQDEIQTIMQAEVWPYAWGPEPADGALHPDTWVNLIWLPGPFAVSHDVYFGDNFNDVDAGIGDTFRGNQTTTSFIAGFPGFPYPDGLVPGTTYYWRIDEVNDVDTNSPWKGAVWSFTVPPKKAYEPNPADGAKFIDSDVTLSWTPGFGAKLHTVYLGDNFDDVNNAAGGLPQGAATYTPGPLELEKVYFWRVDEFDAITTHKGDVWSFTTAGAGGGVRADYFQGTDLRNHVLTRIDPQINFNWGGDAPDESVGLDNFSVRWTGEVEAVFTETYIFYTNSDNGVRLWVDGQQLVDNWTEHSATENSGKLDLVAGQTYSVVMEYYEAGGDAVAELRWSSPRTPKQLIPQAALSPPIKAGSPNPANGATGVKHTVILSWGAGDHAASHQVYFGTDEDAVRNATTASPEYKGGKALGSESFDPGKLPWLTTYYWRVDEVNNIHPDSPWIGNIWSFTTADFLTIDDFESYNDLNPEEEGSNRIFMTWIDGYDQPTNGSQVGYTDPPFCEQGIVYSGRQSMPLFYDNSGPAYYSEATLPLSDTRDWTEEGVKILTLWFYGDQANAAESMYVAVANATGPTAVVYHDNPDAVLIDAWTEWNIDLEEISNQGVVLTNVDSFSIGFGNRSNPQVGGSGMVFIDDIRLYRPATEP